MYKAALVLEGGALRSLYTAGVLDVFIENDLQLAYVIGVSAGALCGLNYITGQKGRTAEINIGYNTDPRYISYRNRIFADGMINIDYLFEEPGGRWAAFDHETYDADTRAYVIGATNCANGKLALFHKPSGKALIPALKASCAMPVASKRITVDGKQYMDGGIADSIPYEAALQAGYEKIIVIKTQHRGYRKQPYSGAERLALKALYGRSPTLYEALLTRPMRYNDQMDSLRALHGQGKVYVIEPSSPVRISHMEKDKDKLRGLYHRAVDQANALLPEITAYLMA